MSKTLEEQIFETIDNTVFVQDCSGGCEGCECYSSVGNKREAARECTKVAQIYALEQQIELLKDIEKVVDPFHYDAAPEIKRLEKQLKVLKDGTT